MAHVRFGGKRGKRVRLAVNPELVVVRTHDRRETRTGLDTRAASRALEDARTVARFPEAGVEVLRFKRSVAARARAALKKEPNVRFAGRVLCRGGSPEPVLYTENFFIKFSDDATRKDVRRLLKKYRLKSKRELPYAGQACFAEAREGTGQKIFEIADRLLQDQRVELCHPELVQIAERKGPNPKQWHLMRTTVNGNRVDEHAAVKAAWAASEGEGVVIAVIDDGVDVDHEEFAGGWKVVAPRDVTRDVGDARPYYTSDNHGTACAGVAVANGNHEASGVAPRARLMPIRLRSSLGSQDEADAFVWAADHGADVISCSWGPTDGRGTHDPLPDSTRLAIDYAIDNGRAGKGCVITWAAGNGNESVDLDGYASYDKVIAVGACNDRGKKSEYSDHGDAVWCVFPSNDYWWNHPHTPGIWTTDRVGSAGKHPTDYREDFGGTSSACPGAAGVAALVLAHNPELRWDEVRDIFRRCCDKIDTSRGRYDADGRSKLYGYGRLNAKRAVDLARPTSRKTVRHTTIRKVRIRDLAKSRIEVAVGDDQAVRAARVHVDIEHTYRGDLWVRLIPPAASGAAAVWLHQGAGGSARHLKQVYDAVSTPGLAALAGISPTGAWKLEVEDRAREDTGQILSFSVELDL